MPLGARSNVHGALGVGYCRSGPPLCRSTACDRDRPWGAGRATRRTGSGRGCRQIADRTSGGVRSVTVPRGPSWRGEHNLPQRRSTVRRGRAGLPGGDAPTTSRAAVAAAEAVHRSRPRSARRRAPRRAARGRRPPAARRRGRDRRRRRAETGLPEARLRSELERTAGQLEAFARASCAAGDYVEAIIDTARPRRDADPAPGRAGACSCRSGRSPCSGPATSRSPSPSPAATPPRAGRRLPGRRQGPPVAPRDRAPSSRASSRPPPARPGLPEGTFALLQAGGRRGRRGARRRARDRRGRLHRLASRGGRALFDRAAARPHPIPVYAEMGSVNPIVVTERRAHRARRRDRRGPGGVGRHVRRPAVHEARRRVRAGGRRGRRVHRRRRRQARRARPRGAAQRAPARRADAPASRRCGELAQARRAARRPRRARASASARPPTPPRAADLVALARAARGALRPDRAAAQLRRPRRAAGRASRAWRASSPAPSTRARATSSSSASSWRC